MKRKIKKIFFEVISNSKIFNIKFFFLNEIDNNQDFPKLTGARQGGLDNVEYGNKVYFLIISNNYFNIMRIKIKREKEYKL